MGNSKKEISCLLMVLATSVSMAGKKVLQERKNEVPTASKVVARKTVDGEGDEQSSVDLHSQEWGVKGVKKIPEYPLTRFFNKCKKMLFEDMDFRSVIAEIDENREDFTSDLERLIDQFSNLKTSHQSAALVVAMVLGREDLVKKIVTWKIAVTDDVILGWSPIYYAIFLGRLDYLKLFTGQGANVNSPACDGCTLLMSAIKEVNIPMVEFLLNHEKIQLFTRDGLGNSALDYANESGNLGIIALVENAMDAAGPEDTVSGEADKTKDQQSSESEYEEEEDDDYDTEEDSLWEEEEDDDYEEDEESTPKKNISLPENKIEKKITSSQKTVEEIIETSKGKIAKM
ncbi:MAG: ankyrin repeat domain-containing protein [Puniceicoccales bacterium]|jgi:hypothetical protein|nr:ankyrin repeat domain-containing protein [Puniceicoccales bacterium]